MPRLWGHKGSAEIVAVKAKAKKKVKKKEIQHVVSQKRIQQAMGDAAVDADKKFAYAKRILDANGQELTDTVERMVEILGKNNDPKLRVDGVSVEYDQSELRAFNRKLHYWVAVRLLVAAAEWDIRISGFKLPKRRCARCGKKVAK